MRGKVVGGTRQRRRQQREEEKEGLSWLSKIVDSIFTFVRLAEFEILFVFFFLIAFLLFKHLTSRPEYNQILVKKPEGEGHDFWPF